MWWKCQTKPSRPCSVTCFNKLGVCVQSRVQVKRTNLAFALFKTWSQPLQLKRAGCQLKALYVKSLSSEWSSDLWRNRFCSRAASEESVTRSHSHFTPLSVPLQSWLTAAQLCVELLLMFMHGSPCVCLCACNCVTHPASTMKKSKRFHVSPR